MSITQARQLGAAVRAERVRREVTQHRLAQDSGVSRAWLARFETGHPTASIEQVLRVLNALGLAIELAPPRTNDAEDAIRAALAARRSNDA